MGLISIRNKSEFKETHNQYQEIRCNKTLRSASLIYKAKTD